MRNEDSYQMSISLQKLNVYELISGFLCQPCLLSVVLMAAKEVPLPSPQPSALLWLSSMDTELNKQ
jgi:hypothetical protein